MKPKRSILPLLALLALLLADRVTAQTFTTLHNFTVGSGGFQPYGSLILSGSNTLYGTTRFGGNWNKGAVFKVNTDGGGFTNLRSFTGGSDGANPYAGLVLSGNILYGTTAEGGNSGYGVVFAVSTNGANFTNLYSFTGSNDGAYPYAGLILSGNKLFGTATGGGSSNSYGTIFKVNTDGTGFTNLHSFTGVSDGTTPIAGLILSDNTLYGTAAGSFPSLGIIGFNSVGNGTVFAINTDGTSFTNLHSFTGGSDGANPFSVLVLSNNTLYGTAAGGGSSGYGTVFAVNSDGTGFTNLHNFAVSDGASPRAMILSGNTLFGTAASGGSSDVGTVFAINSDGTSFTTLHSFADYLSEGAVPIAGLILLGNILYGTTRNGGSSDNGTVFSLSFTPSLTIVPADTNIILSWPKNFAGFDYTGFMLQSTTNLGSAVWSTNLPSPVVLDGQNTVTNPITGAPQFFRLISN